MVAARRTSSRWTGSRSCAGSSGPRAASGSGRRPATPSWPVIRTSGHAGRPSPTPPRSSARRRRATSGRSAATSPTPRRPPRRAGRCSASRQRWRSGRRRATAGSRSADLFSGPGRTTIRPDELIVAIVLPELDGAGSCYVRLEFRRQMEIAVVGATAVVSPRGRHRPRCPDRHHRARPDGPAGRRGRGSAHRDGWRAGGGRGGGQPGRRDVRRRSPTSARRSTYRRAMAAVVVRRAVTGAIARARGETIPIPASASTFGAR